MEKQLLTFKLSNDGNLPFLNITLPTVFPLFKLNDKKYHSYEDYINFIIHKRSKHIIDGPDKDELSIIGKVLDTLFTSIPFVFSISDIGNVSINIRYIDNFREILNSSKSYSLDNKPNAYKSFVIKQFDIMVMEIESIGMKLMAYQKISNCIEECFNSFTLYFFDYIFEFNIVNYYHYRIYSSNNNGLGMNNTSVGCREYIMLIKEYLDSYCSSCKMNVERMMKRVLPFVKSKYLYLYRNVWPSINIIIENMRNKVNTFGGNFRGNSKDLIDARIFVCEYLNIIETILNKNDTNYSTIHHSKYIIDSMKLNYFAMFRLTARVENVMRNSMNKFYNNVLIEYANPKIRDIYYNHFYKNRFAHTINNIDDYIFDEYYNESYDYKYDMFTDEKIISEYDNTLESINILTSKSDFTFINFYDMSQSIFDPDLLAEIIDMKENEIRDLDESYYLSQYEMMVKNELTFADDDTLEYYTYFNKDNNVDTYVFDNNIRWIKGIEYYLVRNITCMINGRKYYQTSEDLVISSIFNKYSGYDIQNNSVRIPLLFLQDVLKYENINNEIIGIVLTYNDFNGLVYCGVNSKIEIPKNTKLQVNISYHTVKYNFSNSENYNIRYSANIDYPIFNITKTFNNTNNIILFARTTELDGDKFDGEVQYHNYTIESYHDLTSYNKFCNKHSKFVMNKISDMTDNVFGFYRICKDISLENNNAALIVNLLKNDNEKLGSITKDTTINEILDMYMEYIDDNFLNMYRNRIIEKIIEIGKINCSNVSTKTNRASVIREVRINNTNVDISNSIDGIHLLNIGNYVKMNNGIVQITVVTNRHCELILGKL